MHFSGREKAHVNQTCHNEATLRGAYSLANLPTVTSNQRAEEQGWNACDFKHSKLNIETRGQIIKVTEEPRCN